MMSNTGKGIIFMPNTMLGILYTSNGINRRITDWSINMATVSDILVIESGEFQLPSLITTAKGTTHIRGIQDLKFSLPAGVTGNGIVYRLISQAATIPNPNKRCRYEK